MRLDGDDARKVLAAVADPESWSILQCVLRGRKDAMAIERELALPQSTVYRKLTQLRESGLIMVDEFVIKPGGKRDTIYTTTFQEIHFVAELEGIEIEIVESQKSIERRWFTLFRLNRPSRAEAPSSVS
ncbi:MAG TPA: hypothetical protein VJR06_03270 [Nitrososphaerales archaeon]|nr:hypothetical protein [Nitrososphaerales archaeon]